MFFIHLLILLQHNVDMVLEFLYGFFKSKRIVLFDTLLKQASDEEIVAVLAHELGHWHHGHVLLTFAISQLYVFAAFYFFAGCMGSVDIYNAFGFRAVAGASDTAGAPVIPRPAPSPA